MLEKKRYKICAVDEGCSLTLPAFNDIDIIEYVEIVQLLSEKKGMALQCLILVTEENLPNLESNLKKWLHEHDDFIFSVIICINDSVDISGEIDDFIDKHPQVFVSFLEKNAQERIIRQTVKSSFANNALKRSHDRLKTRLDYNTEDLRKIAYVGQSLATEHNFSKLIEMILLTARELVSADGGSIYLVEPTPEDENVNQLRFMKSALDLEANEFVLPINTKSIAGTVALKAEPLIIDDVYKLPEGVEFFFNSEFDKAHDYHTKSMLVIPMTNNRSEVIGVLQLINRKKDFNKQLTVEEMAGDEVIPFSNKDYELVTAIAGQAAVAIENQRLLNDQKKLLESFIQLIAGAIDAKSEYTGAHCERVPVLTLMLAEAAVNDQGRFKDFTLSSDEWYELKIAAWLHDCGKIVTPVHVMDKATKLETIYDRIHEIKQKFIILRKEAEIRKLEAIIEGNSSVIEIKEEYESALQQINQWQELVVRTNTGGEFLAEEQKQLISQLGLVFYRDGEAEYPLLNENEIKNLCVSKGTLTEEERIIINSHMVETIKMLEKLPFPKNLKRVPEYAGGHHEKMDGKGYPKGIYAGDMSLPARMMAIADVFEALTAADRPYKKGLKLSQAMSIMGKMKSENHLDPELFDLFISSKVYRIYAEKYLSADLIDEIDEQSLLQLKPKEFQLPPDPERRLRRKSFLPEYITKPATNTVS